MTLGRLSAVRRREVIPVVVVVVFIQSCGHKTK